jgi:hypothetical protein
MSTHAIDRQHLVAAFAAWQKDVRNAPDTFRPPAECTALPEQQLAEESADTLLDYPSRVQAGA